MALIGLAAPGAGAEAPALPQGYPGDESLRRYAAGRLLEEQGDTEGALAEYYRVVALDPRSISALLRVSEVAAQRGEFRRSIEFAERALAVDSTDARALWLRGSAEFSLERYADAILSLERSVASDSGRAEYWGTLARAAEFLDRFDIVARASRHVVDLEPANGESWFQLAAAEARLRRFGAARRALTEAQDLQPGRPGLEFLEGWIAEGLNEREEAIRAYRAHLQGHPDDGVTRQRLVQLLALSGRYKEGLAEIRALSKSAPADPDVVQIEAMLAFDAGLLAEGLEALHRLETMAPDDADNLGRRVEILARAKRPREAAQAAAAWSARHRSDYRGPMVLARAQALAGDSVHAIESARAAIAQAPDSLAPRLLLGTILQGQSRWAEAAEVWRGVLSRRPELFGTALDLAICQERLGDFDGAEATARALVQRVPDNATALNFLGYLLADRNRKLDEAESLIRRAVEIDPDNGAYVDSMGWVYYRLGRLSDARRELEKAAKLTDGDAEVLEHLGDVYRELRLIDLARDQYRRSLAANGHNPRLREKLETLR